MLGGLFFVLFCKKKCRVKLKHGRGVSRLFLLGSLGRAILGGTSGLSDGASNSLLGRGQLGLGGSESSSLV